MNSIDTRLAALYRRYDGPVPKHLLEAARTGKTQIEIAIDTLRRQAKWNMAKAGDWEQCAIRGYKSSDVDVRLRSKLHMKDALFHRNAARRQYREAQKLEAERREAEGRAT